MQNSKSINDYQEKLDSGLLAYSKGFTLNAEDELRKFIINQLICHFSVDFNEVNAKFNIDMQTHFYQQLQQLTPMIEDGLLRIDALGIKVQTAGRMLIRRICMVFDEYLANNQQLKFSKIM
jgi:oxygen-independent coproporphyrinogen-3 oxidase